MAHSTYDRSLQTLGQKSVASAQGLSTDLKTLLFKHKSIFLKLVDPVNLVMVIKDKPCHLV